MKWLVYAWAPVANLLWYIETIVMGTISLALWPFDRTGELQHACARWWCRMVAVTIGARIRVHGVERVQAGRPYVYMANHSSLIDTPALFAYLPHQFKIMAKTGAVLRAVHGLASLVVGQLPGRSR